MYTLRKSALMAALLCSGVLNAWASADHMVIAMPQIPTIIEPQGINNNAIDRYVGNVFETLLTADQKTGELKPGLAESWKRLSPETVEFKLRAGVTFHDGTPLTADDVVFSFGPERFSGEKAPGRAVAWEFLGNLKEVSKVDELTVRVTMKSPDPMIERRFSARTSEIISEDGWKAAGGWDKWLKAPIGTGPYRIAGFKTGNRLELARFDGYWGKAAPAAKVSFVEVPELSARVAGLRSGEFDLITEVPPDQVKPLSSDGRIDVVGGAIDNIYGLVFDNKSSPVMQSKELRQAILLAIDRDLLVNALFAGRTTTADAFESKTFGELCVDAGPKLYDPAKAKALVKASGYRGEPIVWRIQAGYYTQELVVTQAIASMLKAAGLNVKIEVKENWTQVEAPGRDRMINNASFSAYYPDPVAQLWRRLKPSSFWVQNGYVADSAQYKRFCELGEKLETSIDPAERRAAWSEMLKVFAEDPWACPLYSLPMLYAKQKNVTWEASSLQGNLNLSADNLSFK